MEKWTQEQYAARLQEMKQEAHDKMWLYIEVNAKEFMNECEPGVKNLASCCKAMLDAMLEGDGFIVEPKICLLYTSPSPRDGLLSRMPSSA